MNQDILSKNLKHLRKLLNLTQEEFANNLSITGSYISDVERGKSVISNSILCLMEINYRINRDWLLKGEGEPFVKEWLDNKLNLFAEQGGPILDNFKMELEVVNPSNPSAKPGFHKAPAADPWQGTIKKAREILESGLSDSKALANYIECAHSSMQEKQDLKNTVDQIKQQLSTGREKEETSDAALAAAS